MPSSTIFNEENIQRLFGHEAAEDEDPQRLREYYFKSNIYAQAIADLPLRIVVGHKGIGKSALFKVAMAEDKDKDKISIIVQPNDITHLPTENQDFLQIIRYWTEGLCEIIIQKVLQSFGYSKKSINLANLENYIYSEKGVTNFIIEYLQNNKTEQNLDNFQISKFLKNAKITIYIDDLDRGWQGMKGDVLRISALLNAVRDISNDNRSLSFKVALRSDVYYLVRTSDESTDKIEGSVIWHSWTNHEIYAMFIKRIETYFGRHVDESKLLQSRPRQIAHYLDPILEPRFSGRGHWSNAPIYRVLMSLIRKRPRDLVKLCTLAARRTYIRGSNIIQTQDFEDVFEEYSQGRIQDTVNEFKSELPLIEALIMNMKPNRRERETKLGYVYNTAGLLVKLENISQLQNFRFSNGEKAFPKDLAAFLFKINFLTARKEVSDGIIRKYFEENRYLSSSFSDFGFDWEVHPAYRWALQPDRISEIYKELKLNSEEEMG